MITATPTQIFPTVLEAADPSIAADLTVGIDNEDGSVKVAQDATGITEIESPSGLYKRNPGFAAPLDPGLYFVVWKRLGDVYATEDLIVYSPIAVEDVVTTDVTLRPGKFPPGSTVKIWDRSGLSGPHPPPSEPPEATYRGNVTVGADSTIFYPALPVGGSFIVGQTVGQTWSYVNVDVREPSASELENRQLSDLYGRFIAETDQRIEADQVESDARVAGDRAEADVRADADSTETAARIAADTAESSARSAAVTAEASARATADTTETNARVAAVTAEASTRAAADTAEASARAAADSSEASTRAAADLLRVLKDAEVVSVLNHGLVANDGTDQLAAWNTLIAAINAGTYSAVYFPPGTYNFSNVPDAITADNILIYGAGPATILKFLTSAAHGTFFTLGASGGDGASGVVIKDLTLQCNASGNVPPASERAFHLVKGGTCFVRNIRVLEIGGLCKIGTTTAGDRMQLYGFRDVFGSWNAATVAPSRIHIVNGTDGRYVNIRLTANEVNGGIGIHADPTSQGVDQHFFDNVEAWSMGSHSQNIAHGTTYDGIDWNVVLDFLTGQIINWVFKNCVFDEGRAGAVRMFATGGANGLKDIHFLDCHFATNAGRGILITNAGTGEVRAIQVTGGRIRYKDFPAVEIHSATVGSFLAQGVSMMQDNANYVSANTTRESIVHTFKHGRAVDDEIVFSGSPPAPLVAGTSYYVKTADATGDGLEFTVAATVGGATINITATAAGSYYVGVDAAVQISDCLGVRVSACHVGAFGGANPATNYAVKGIGSPDYYAIVGNVAVGMRTGFSTGIANDAAAASTKVNAENVPRP